MRGYDNGRVGMTVRGRYDSGIVMPDLIGHLGYLGMDTRIRGYDRFGRGWVRQLMAAMTVRGMNTRMRGCDNYESSASAKGLAAWSLAES